MDETLSIYAPTKPVLMAQAQTEPEPPVDDTWYWAHPWQFYSSPPSSGRPAILRFGDSNNPDYSPQTPLTEEWQYVWADCLSYAEYDKPYSQLSREQRDNIRRAWRTIIGDGFALSNNTGYNGTPRADFISRRDMDREVPRLDQVRGFCTNSYKGDVVINSHGQEMLEVLAFDFYNPPAMYGREILGHPAVQFGCNIYPGGAVGKWPQLKADVPCLLITREPVYYYRSRMTAYTGERRPIGYVPGFWEWVRNRFFR